MGGSFASRDFAIRRLVKSRLAKLPPIADLRKEMERTGALMPSRPPIAFRTEELAGAAPDAEIR
ncbi:MAG: hypothetical protein AAF909_01205, partial [Pseudomonadota bacterium]